jgi:putative peptidoglycan lipid II flippase
MSFLRAIATVSGYTALSRVLGFVRDMIIADSLGAGQMADAFFVAFKLPNFFRQLFGEGAFNSAFVPLFAGRAAGEGKGSAVLFAEQALAVLLAALLAMTVLGEIFMPDVIRALAPGFTEQPAKFDLTVALTRITFPYMVFICLAALYSGVLNSLNRFAAAAATPIILNVTTIVAAVGLIPHMASAGHALAWGVIAAGIFQFVWLAVSCRNAGANLHLRLPKLTPSVRELLKRMVPGTIGAGIVQINLLVGTQLASLLPTGAVSYLYYADRLNQLPLAIVATAIGTALLPLLSRQLRAGEFEAANHSQNRALEFALIMTLPAVVGLIVLSTTIVQALFEHGRFGPAETQATAATLIAYVVGLPAYALIKVFTPSFFARGDTRTPVKIAAAAVALNIALNLTLMQFFSYIGIALGTALASWLNALSLLALLRRRRLFQFDDQVRRRGPRLLAAALAQAALLYGAVRLAGMIDQPGRALNIALLAILIALGGAAFFAAAQALGGLDLREVRGLFRRKRA